MKQKFKSTEINSTFNHQIHFYPSLKSHMYTATQPHTIVINLVISCSTILHGTYSVDQLLIRNILCQGVTAGEDTDATGADGVEEAAGRGK